MAANPKNRSARLHHRHPPRFGNRVRLNSMRHDRVLTRRRPHRHERVQRILAVQTVCTTFYTSNHRWTSRRASHFNINRPPRKPVQTSAPGISLPSRSGPPPGPGRSVVIILCLRAGKWPRKAPPATPRCRGPSGTDWASWTHQARLGAFGGAGPAAFADCLARKAIALHPSADVCTPVLEISRR